MHLLIHEEIYLLSQDEIIKDESTVDVSEEVQESSQLAEPELKSIAEKKDESNSEEQPTNEDNREQEQEPIQEPPEIPITEVEEPEELPFAVFHSSSDEAEIDLLHKIIDACKIPGDQYKIFSNGFDQEVKFKKALVFVPEAKAFYTPIPYKGSEFLCSKPLADLAKDKNEKVKLWGALQKFVSSS